MDRKLHRPEEVRMRQSEKDRNPYSDSQALKHIDYNNDDFDGEIEEREKEIEERNDTAGGLGAWGGS